MPPPSYSRLYSEISMALSVDLKGWFIWIQKDLIYPLSCASIGSIAGHFRQAVVHGACLRRTGAKSAGEVTGWQARQRGGPVEPSWRRGAPGPQVRAFRTFFARVVIFARLIHAARIVSTLDSQANANSGSVRVPRRRPLPVQSCCGFAFEVRE